MKNRVERSRQIRFSWLDFKVGLRMLARYPGLTVVGTIAIAVAIALGSLYFEALNKWQNPKLPIRDADRVVSILNWDAGEVETEGRSLHDFAVWRQQAKTIENMGAADITLSPGIVARLDALINQQTVHGPRYNQATQQEIDTEQFV